MTRQAPTVESWRYLGIDGKGRKAKLRLMVSLKGQPEAVVRAHLGGPLGTISAYVFRTPGREPIKLSFPAVRVRAGEHSVELDVNDSRAGVLRFDVP